MTKAPTTKPVKSSKKKAKVLGYVIAEQQLKAKKAQLEENVQVYLETQALSAEHKKKQKLAKDELELKKLVESANEFLETRKDKSVSYKKEFDTFTTNSQVKEEFKVLALPIRVRFLALWDTRFSLVLQLRNELTNPQKSNPELIKSLMQALQKLEQDYVHIQGFLKSPSHDTYKKIPVDFKPTDALSPSKTISTDILRPTPKPKPKPKRDDYEPNAAQPKTNR